MSILSLGIPRELLYGKTKTKSLKAPLEQANRLQGKKRELRSGLGSGGAEKSVSECELNLCLL